HHWYRPRELQAVTRRARAMGAGVLVTSEKDAVRLGPSAAAMTAEPAAPVESADGPLPIWVLRVRLEPVAEASVARTRSAPGERSVDLWRAELRSRVDAAARAAHSATSP